MSLCQGWWRRWRQGEFTATRGFQAPVPEELGPLPGLKASKPGKAELRQSPPPPACSRQRTQGPVRSRDPVSKKLCTNNANDSLNSVSHCVRSCRVGLIRLSWPWSPAKPCAKPRTHHFPSASAIYLSHACGPGTY